ncbi:MAG: InlB B-repeat-containing protein [Lachnospiraceae bacterium]|nr:InlB B-repeat-containing protein [Lachnospiraceae bacterium]
MGGNVDVTRLSVAKKGRIGSLPVPVRKGYRFLGWYTKKSGGKKVTAKTKVSSLKKRVLYAHWQMRKYKIRYVYNNGKMKSGQKNPTKYTVQDKIKLKSPVRDGYVFKGWYTTKNFASGTKVSTIRKGSAGKLTLYAKFEPITYKIQFQGNYTIETVPKTMVCQYGKSYTLPGSDEVSFDHWTTEKDGSGKSYKAGKKVKNLTSVNGQTVTLYAYAFSGKNNIEKLTKYFVRLGYTKQAAAAIAGNLMYESGGGASDIKLNAVEWSTGRGVGMVQWTDTTDAPRRTNFTRFCASRGKPWPNKDLKVQVDFLLAELAGKYGKVWIFSPRMGYPASYEMSLAKFKKCKNLEKAVQAFCANFERPYASNANLSTRIRFARIALSYVS